MYNSIIIPIDLADIEIARPAIAKATALARQSGGRVTLVNVVPIVPVMMLDTVPVSYESEIADSSKQALADIAASIDLPSDKVSAFIKIGGVYNEVLDIAKETAADLIIVGSHPPTMSSYILGSNATAIVRHATCSVLIVREEAAAQAPQ